MRWIFPLIVLVFGCDGDKDQDTAPPVWTQVAVDDYSGCGLSSTGNVACWDEYDGVDPDTIDIVTSVPSGVYSEVAFYTNACALTSMGDPVCWGSRWDEYAPEMVLPAGPLHGLSVGIAYACALTSTNEVVCWGYDGYPEHPLDGEYTQVSVGSHLYCAIAADNGALACWGTDEDGVANAPTDDGYAQVACGEACCWTRPDGYSGCWTRYDAEELYPEVPLYSMDVGTTFNDDEETPLICGITSNMDELLCWDDTTGASNPDINPAPSGKWLGVSAGGSTAAGVTTTGEIEYVYGFQATIPDPP